MLLNESVIILFSSVGYLGRPTENEYISREQPTGYSGCVAYITLRDGRRQLDETDGWKLTMDLIRSFLSPH